MENVPVHDDACEKIVLGTLISKKNALSGSKLNEKCFYSQKNKDIFKAIESIEKRGDGADIVTLMAELRKSGVQIEPYELVEIAGNVTFELSQHVRRLIELSIRRDMYEKAYYMLENGVSERDDITDVLSEVENFTRGAYDIGEGNNKSCVDFINEAISDIKTNLSSSKPSGTYTGFQEFDRNFGGFQPTDLIVIAGASSQGKTSLADSICANALKNKAKIAFYSLEMTGAQLMKRFAAMESGVNAKKIMYMPLEREEIIAVNTAFDRMASWALYFDESSVSSLDNIIYSIRSQSAKNGINGAIIDYVQIINLGNSNDTEAKKLEDCARRLKNLAKELKIWIIVLSQLNRNIQFPEPNVDRLKGSSGLNDAADITILVYRAGVYGKPYSGTLEQFETEGTMQIEVAKGRNVGMFKFLAGFDSETTKVYPLTTYPVKGTEAVRIPDSVNPF